MTPALRKCLLRSVLVAASIRTSYRARQPLESTYYAGDTNYDWLFRLIETIVR